MFVLPELSRLEDCCWQNIRNRGSSDSMRDTGVMNSSPVATMSPIVRLLAGCQHSFRIPGKHLELTASSMYIENTTENG